MTILSPRTTTAGLKVPADSHPSPRGAMTGAFDSRFHGPNGERLASWANGEASNAKRSSSFGEVRGWINLWSLGPGLALFLESRHPDMAHRPRHQTVFRRTIPSNRLRHLPLSSRFA